METFFSADFFASNRRKLRQAVGGEAPIVVTTNGVMQRSGDEPYKFRQDSGFYYLTGIDTPDLVLVMTTHETYLIAPTLTFEREAFDGAHDTAAFAARSGIDTLYNEKEGWAKLKTALQKHNAVATPAALPEHMKRHGLYANPARRRLISKLKRTVPQLAVQDIRPQLAELRSYKQPAELLALRRAIDITIETIEEIRKPAFLRSIHHEYNLEAAISYGFRNRGSAGHAFSPIVAAGKNAATIHHMSNNDPVTEGDMIIVDIGAEFEHYAADISRTLCSRPLEGRKKQVYEAVLAVQNFALSQLKHGCVPLDYEKAVEAYMGEQLRALKLVQEPTHEAIRRYFPHATSHFLGLDTHDAGDYRKPYEAGMVITCEPGIYIPEEGIGVRIEDDVLITANGYELLTSACPRQAF
jgi:Xaa-Pro aminopeptidase